MAYTKPTPADIKARWPAIFGDVPDPTIQIWIDTAVLSVDESWLETDYKFGIELLAGHLMIENGIGKGAQAEANAGGMSAFQTIKSGQLTLTRGATSQDASGVPSPWNSTGFGVQWYWLARKNRPPATVAAGGPNFGPSAYAKDWPLGTGGWQDGPLWGRGS